jgi:hypothetical protein
MSVRPRHIVLLSVLTGGSALLGASAHGLAVLDDRLAAAAQPTAIERTFEQIDRDCPARERDRANNEI